MLGPPTGHEYAEDNLLFAAEVEPRNSTRENKYQWVLQQRSQKLSTVRAICQHCSAAPAQSQNGFLLPLPAPGETELIARVQRTCCQSPMSVRTPLFQARCRVSSAIQSAAEQRFAVQWRAYPEFRLLLIWHQRSVTPEAASRSLSVWICQILFLKPAEWSIKVVVVVFCC